jgi:hypothetical protein
MNIYNLKISTTPQSYFFDKTYNIQLQSDSIGFYIVYSVARARSKLFRSWAMCAAPAAGENRVLPMNEFTFPREPHILYFVTPLRSWKRYFRDLCNSRKQFHEKNVILFHNYYNFHFINIYL